MLLGVASLSPSLIPALWNIGILLVYHSYNRQNYTRGLSLCFYCIVEVKTKKYIFGAVIFEVTAQRRSMGQKLDIISGLDPAISIHHC